jgi:hypothetical protein
MYIPLFPKTRALRFLYMAFVLLFMGGLLGEAWRIFAAERSFSSHAAVADVFLFNGYRETTAVTGDNGQRKDVGLGFHTAEGDTVTVSQDLGDEEVATLKSGGTLQMQYLPEHPQASGRLVGHSKPAWPDLILAGVLAVYALALKPEAASSPTRQRA